MRELAQESSERHGDSKASAGVRAGTRAPIGQDRARATRCAGARYAPARAQAGSGATPAAQARNGRGLPEPRVTCTTRDMSSEWLHPERLTSLRRSAGHRHSSVPHMSLARAPSTAGGAAADSVNSPNAGEKAWPARGGCQDRNLPYGHGPVTFD